MSDCPICAKWERAERMAKAVEDGADLSDVIGLPGVDFPTKHDDGRELTLLEAAHYVVSGGTE